MSRSRYTLFVAILFAGSFAKVVGQFKAMFGWLVCLSLPLVPKLSASILRRHLSVGRANVTCLIASLNLTLLLSTDFVIFYVLSEAIII